jgi:pyridoxine 5-phosphate synthase
MTRLSVNINKVALIRNSRGGNLPDLRQFAIDCEEFGAQGITVHPRPDERHIRYSDIPILKEVVSTEFNIEGYPSADFINLVIKNKPDQCTLVPDPPGVLTSSEGWDTINKRVLLKEVIKILHDGGVRVSLFLDPVEEMVEGALDCGADRVEFYTGKYAEVFFEDRDAAIMAHKKAAKKAELIGIGVNAGHDLNLDNLKFYNQSITNLKEVSIGHALISDALYHGIKNTIHMYLSQLS